MRIQKNVCMGNLLDDIGSIGRSAGGVLMDSARGVISLAKDARGDTPNQVVTGAAPVSYTNLVVYGVLAALALSMVVKK